MKDKVKKNHNSRDEDIDEHSPHKASEDVVNDIVLCLEVRERLGGDSEIGGEVPGADPEERVVVVKD